MARTNSLTNFLTDVAAAIKEKKGSQTDIAAENFDTEIENLPTGGGGTYQTKEIDILQNGSTLVFPDTGYDALDEVMVFTSVPITSFTEYQNCQNIADAILGDAVEPVSGYRIYYDKNMTDKSSYHRNGTLSGSYTTTSQGINFTGGYATTGNISSARGTWEIYCKVNSTFTPRSSSNWYECSCIMGCELSERQQDFGIIINSTGYVGIGYSMSSISASSIKINDGQFHHLVITTTSSDLKLYIDGILVKIVTYSMTGTSPTQYGIFWNKMAANTAVRGTFTLFRYYSTVLTTDQIRRNYMSAIYEE